MHSVSDPSTSMTAIIGPKWFGDLPQSLSFSGEVIVGSNLTIPSGKALTVTSGTTIKSDANTSITSYGQLSAGSATFTSSSPSSSWSGIVISGSGANNSSLENCTVEHVLTYGGAALFVDGASGVQIQYCNISNNVNFATSGLSFINAGNPDIYHNTINSNGSYGVKFQNTNGNIRSNTITSNSSGVYCYNSASPSFGKIGYYYSTSNSNNTISGGNYGVVVSSYSNPYIGSTNSSSVGYNRITSTSSARIHAYNYCDIIAERNWWGSDPPDDGWFQYDGGSWVDRGSWLTSDPGPAPRMGEVVGPAILLSRQNVGAVEKDKDWRKTLQMAVEDRINGRYDDAKQLLHKLIATSPAPEAPTYAAVEFLQLYRATLDDDIVRLTRSNLVQKRVPEAVSQLILAKMLSLKPEKGETIDLLNAVASGNPGTEQEKLALLDLFHLYYASPQYASSLSIPLTSLLKNHPDDPDVKEALWLSQIRGGTASGQESQFAGSSGGQISNDLRLENYPNPFNPSTVVSFSVPEAGLVTLKIYDVIGREVMSLVNEFKTAGTHSANFNGSTLASGMYVARLQMAGKSVAAKLLLAR